MLSIIKPAMPYPLDFQDWPGQHPYGHPIHLGHYTDPQRTFGLYGQLEQATLDLGVGNAVFGGRQGAGRTNILHKIMADCVFWPDTVLMAIDGHGGLVRPWLAGAGRDLFARVAAEQHSALDTIAHLEKILHHRQRTYLPALQAHDGPYLTAGDGETPCTECGHPHPQGIVLLIDDGVLHTYKHVQALSELFSHTRNWGIRVVLVRQSGRVGQVPRDMLVNARTVGVLPTGEPEEQEFLLGAKLPHMPIRPGEGFLKQYGTPPRQVQFDRMPIKKISAIAAHPALSQRPQLGSVEADLGGETFHRWQDDPAVEWMLQDCR